MKECQLVSDGGRSHVLVSPLMPEGAIVIGCSRSGQQIFSHNSPTHADDDTGVDGLETRGHPYMTSALKGGGLAQKKM